MTYQIRKRYKSTSWKWKTQNRAHWRRASRGKGPTELLRQPEAWEKNIQGETSLSSLSPQFSRLARFFPNYYIHRLSNYKQLMNFFLFFKSFSFALSCSLLALCILPSIFSYSFAKQPDQAKAYVFGTCWKISMRKYLLLIGSFLVANTTT